MMPQSSQNLYFHLGMNADDDGFCEHFTIMRMTESKPDDLKVLQAKGFVKIFDDKVLVITDWKENNYLRSDRYSPSKYLEVYKDELKGLSSGIPEVDQMATQDRIGKDRIGKVNPTASGAGEIPEIIKLFEEVNPTIQRMYGNTSQRAAVKRMLTRFGREKLEEMIKSLTKINAQKYWPKSTTPCQLENNIPIYKAKADELKGEKNKVVFI